MAINESIKCRVDSCRHNESSHCSLNDITVGSDKCKRARECCETECENFETY